MAQTTTLEAIEAALAIAVARRPPRRDGTAAEGRYASLAITALEEARNWERNRESVAQSRANFQEFDETRTAIRRP